ncbi:glycosyl hydrolase [Litoribaculum gwangyangense]|uniref:GH26 domain-containing protein n=1 Tax=Litoribaculum gwangyangense TaxID=1130722 RepID=A0ABP9CM98_9FLAO
MNKFNSHIKIGVIALLTVFVNSCSKDNIEEPDGEPAVVSKITISTNTNVLTEPSLNGSFKLTLTKIVNKTTTVNYTISGTATNGEDYKMIDTKIDIPANNLSILIPIEIKDDGETEENETIIITLTNTNNPDVEIGDSNSAMITISANTETFVLQPNETLNYMVNQNATSETIALFYNLKILSQTKYLIGQHDAFSSFYMDAGGDSDIKKTTGSDPSLLGSDFMFITDDLNNELLSNWYFQQEQLITGHAKEAYNKGMVNIFAWHFREPFEGLHFYTSEMTTYQKQNAFKSILPGGSNHDYYKTKLEKIADVAKSMIGNNGELVPFIFRPFHEFDGDWFWWGAPYSTAEEFKTLWRFTVEYLRDVLQVNNILFAFSPDNKYNNDTEYLERYPGDAYVDVLGMDNYGDFKNKGQMGVDEANKKLKVISDLAIQKVKIAALTETCYFVEPGVSNPITDFYSNNLYQALTKNEVELGFMMFWSNSKDRYCTPTPGLSTTPDFITFTNKAESVLQNEIPNMYQLPN